MSVINELNASLKEAMKVAKKSYKKSKPSGVTKKHHKNKNIIQKKT